MKILLPMVINKVGWYGILFRGNAYFGFLPFLTKHIKGLNNGRK